MKKNDNFNYIKNVEYFIPINGNYLKVIKEKAIEYVKGKNAKTIKDSTLSPTKV